MPTTIQCLLLALPLFVLLAQSCPEVESFATLEDFYHKRRLQNSETTLGVRVNLTTGWENYQAACLDGSPGVFYWREGFGDGLNKFHVFLEGGRACAGGGSAVVEAFNSCYQRSLTDLGSSITYEEYLDYDASYLSTDEETNPLTHNWNTVYVKYCDGSFYSSDSDVVISGLYATGFRVLYSVFYEIIDNYNFSNASDLLLSGCSAGGLASDMHADYIYDNLLPSGTNMAVMSDSGFFLEYEGTGQIMSALKWQFDYMNVVGSLNQDCVNSKPTEYQYYCMIPQEVLPYSNVKTLGLQSQYDEFQILEMLVSSDTEEINEYGANFSQTVMDMFDVGNTKNVFTIFLESCYHHCGRFGNIIIDGYNSSQLQYEWYNDLLDSNSSIWFQNVPYPCSDCCNDDSASATASTTQLAAESMSTMTPPMTSDDMETAAENTVEPTTTNLDEDTGDRLCETFRWSRVALCVVACLLISL